MLSNGDASNAVNGGAVNGDAVKPSQSLKSQHPGNLLSTASVQNMSHSVASLPLTPELAEIAARKLNEPRDLGKRLLVCMALVEAADAAGLEYSAWWQRDKCGFALMFLRLATTPAPYAHCHLTPDLPFPLTSPPPGPPSP